MWKISQQALKDLGECPHGFLSEGTIMPGRIITYSGKGPVCMTRPGRTISYADWLRAVGFGHGGVGAPPSATSCVFGGQGGVGAPPSATKVCPPTSFGHGGVGAPPSATSCVFGGQGGVGAPPSATHRGQAFLVTVDEPAVYITSDNATTHRPAATATTLLFTFISIASLNLGKRSVDNPRRWSKHALIGGRADRFFYGSMFTRA